MNTNNETVRFYQHKWRVRNQACVVCGKLRPAGMVMICNQCKERAKNAATEVRT